MREYETGFIVQPEISDEGCQGLCGKLDSILEKGGAVRLMLDDWGKRKLAYEIQKFQKGHYFFLSYLDAGQVVRDVERALRLEESVLRFLTVKVADEVSDIETRRTQAAEQERIQREKAAERAAREAEAEAERAAAEAERARQAAEAEASSDDEAGDDEGSDADEPSEKEE